MNSIYGICLHIGHTPDAHTLDFRHIILWEEVSPMRFEWEKSPERIPGDLASDCVTWASHQTPLDTNFPSLKIRRRSLGPFPLLKSYNSYLSHKYLDQKEMRGGVERNGIDQFSLLITCRFSGLRVPTSSVWERLSQEGNWDRECMFPGEEESVSLDLCLSVSLSMGGQGSVKEVARTHGDTLKGGGVHCPVDLVSDGLVVIVEIFQAHTRTATPSRCLVQGQCQGPDSIIGQRCLLEATCLLGVSF